MAYEKKLSIRLSASGGDKLRREFGKLGKDGKQAFDKITHATKPASAGLKVVNASASALNGVLKQAAGLVGAYAGIQGISRSLGFIVSTNKEFEKLNASLKTVTGSAENASLAFKMIEDFASETPYDIGQITESFIRLKSLGLNPSEEALRSYGNTASAMGKDIMQFVEAIADATTGEFERLKEFGIKASSQGEQVSFTFQGVTTTVQKNAEEIENYLRQIGNVQFAGAMSEQMNTLGGIFSNLQDNISRLAREVGEGGLNDALRDVSLRLVDLSDKGMDTAGTLGETLGKVIRASANSLSFLAENSDIAVEALSALLIARTVAGSISAMNVAIAGNAGAALGLRMMAQLSAGAAAKLVIMEGATKLATIAMTGLKGVLALLGGPTGIIIIASLALYKLAKGHDAASKAAKDHAGEMDELRKSIQGTTSDIEELNTASRNEALARWTQKLELARENIEEVTKQLKQGEIGGFWDQFSRFGSDLQKDLYHIRNAFREGKITVEQYQKALWALAVEYPSFTDNAKEIQEQILALKAAKLAEEKAIAEIERIKSGTTKTTNSKTKTGELHTVIRPEIQTVTSELNANSSLEDTAKWSGDISDNIEQVSNKYDELASQIEETYQGTIQSAREQDLESSESWSSGVKSGLQSVTNEAQNMARETESIITNIFQSMEDSIVNMVSTGKLSFSSLVDSIMSDITRMAVKQSITTPLADFAGSLISSGSLFGIFHSGGVAGYPSSFKYAENSAFYSAPRFHSGGIAGTGLLSDEVPIIARKGELIIPPEKIKQDNGNTSQQKQINIVMNVKATDAGSFKSSKSQITADMARAIDRASRNM